MIASEPLTVLALQFSEVHVRGFKAVELVHQQIAMSKFRFSTTMLVHRDKQCKPTGACMSHLSLLNLRDKYCISSHS